MLFRRLFATAAAALVSILVLQAAALAAPKIEEKILGSATAGGVYGVSPRGVHVGYATSKGSRLVLSVDGEEGPLFDELFTPTGGSFYNGPTTNVIPATSGGGNASTSVPIIFSDNGEHWAYAGRQGNEYVVFYDGKEIARGPRASLALNYGPLTLSPGGKAVYFGEMTHPQSGNPTWRQVVNGKPSPWSGNQTMALVFSPDDNHHAYTAVSVGNSNTFILVVDGKEASYVGLSPVFTADNRLLTIRPNTAQSKPAVLLDGKAIINGLSVDKIVAAPVGSHYAAIVRTRLDGAMGVPMLFIDGKEIAGSDGARSVTFSPDGKHYAAVCVNDTNRSAVMIVDGKKGTEYSSVSDAPVWTADGSKIIYTVISGGRNFVLVNDQEFAVEALQGLLTQNLFPRSATGNHYAFAWGDGMNRKFAVVVDGKPVLADGFYPLGDTLRLNSDGSRYAYLVGPIGRSETTGLVVDGTLMPDFSPSYFAKNPALTPATLAFLFSPDGKHIAAMGHSADQKKYGLFIDGKLAYRNQRGTYTPVFSPDSQHLFWLGSEKDADGPQSHLVVFVDGVPTLQFKENAFLAAKGAYEMGQDGALTFIAPAGDVMKRYRISASADTTLASAVAAVEAADAKALADADAAKKAADEKAAQAKADKDAAAAKAKADADAAAAAKAQARADAVAAKQKARDDAIAARKAKTAK
jgi:hypothetical protein